jgi:hypothetical protein
VLGGGTLGTANAMFISQHDLRVVGMVCIVAGLVARQRFTVIITETDGDLRGFPADLPRYYRRCPQMPLAGVQPAPFRRGTGVQPVSVWLPAGHESCAVVARALAGLPAAGSPAQPGTQSRSGDPR